MALWEVARLFRDGCGLAVIGGKVSGNLECLDFDEPTLFQPFLEALEQIDPDLAAKLTVKVGTPSGGYHLVYRCAKPVDGNLKLAVGRDQDGKRTLIETRGEGGYFLTVPTAGYRAISGELTKCPVITAEERRLLHVLAQSFTEEPVEAAGQPVSATPHGRPGDEYNARWRDVLPALLKRHGWKPTGRHGPGGAHWTRPGKEKGTSATLKDGWFFVFSTNASIPTGPHSAFSVYSYLEHGGDFQAAAKALQEAGFGRRRGERGELGENPSRARNSGGRNTGERGRILGENEVVVMLKQARRLLFRGVTDQDRPPYPVEALGPLAGACKVLVTNGQVPAEIAGQCLLATVALLTQSVANVETLAGTKPLSLYCLTVAESGEGKSTAEEAALRPITEQQRKDGRRYRAILQERRNNGRRQDDSPIVFPREPYRVLKDGTVEGIRRGFKEGLPSQGVFTSEAAVMLAGYGMSEEQRGKTAGNFNSLWDGGELSVARGKDGRLQLYDRRLSIHWLVQPDIAHQAIHDPLLTTVGFWPRFLLASPAPTGPLKARPFKPESFSAIREFWSQCREFLARELGEDCSGLPVIRPTEKALALACRFYEKMQVQAKTEEGILKLIKPFAVRATEQALRIAAVLSVFDGQREIDEGAMRNGITLATYSLDSWLRVFDGKDDDEGRVWALQLYEWLLRRPGLQYPKSAMLKLVTPKHLRSQSRRDTALAVLGEVGLVEENEGIVFAVTREMER